MEVEPRHEGRQTGGASSAWEESHRLDVLIPEQSLAVSLQISARPHWGTASFLAAVLELGELPVVIADVEVPLPEASWEVRASGLWADHICETPLDHWSYGLEAFALAIDNPWELLGRAVGDRVPLGWELEFEASSPAIIESASSALATGVLDGGSGAYHQVGRSHGLLLSSDGQREIDGAAVRSHRWGTDRAADVVVGDRPTGEVTAVLPDIGFNWHLYHDQNGLAAVAEAAADTADL